MNCFNVRELQSLVRKRFFMETLNTNFVTNNLNNSMISLKYKTNNINLNKNNSFINNNFGISNVVNKKININNLNIENQSINLEDFRSYFKLNNFENINTTKRYVQNEYPTLLYKVKIGNYLPDVPFRSTIDHTFNTLNSKTVSNRSSMWYFSSEIIELLKLKNNLTSLLNKDSLNNYASHLDVFYVLKKINNNLNYYNTKFNNNNNVNQKFTNLFMSQTKQTNVLNN